jgi:myosin heavy subunit
MRRFSSNSTCLLKNEQEEYEREGILWSYVSFPDNQDVLDLISKKGAGILDILDDQCRAPGTTDKTFINDLYQKLSRHKRFQADFRQVGARKFAIIHYAGTVEYDSEGFVEKNRDELPKEATELLLSSSNQFVKALAEIISGPSSSPKSGSRSAPKSKSTVGGQFSRQLQELRQKIDLTTPHYVRCLKPNDELEPDLFDPLIVADQLRCAGVIEAVKVSRLGYPQRYAHSRFLSRYRLLGQRALKKSNGASRRRKPVDVLVEAIAEKIALLSSKNAPAGVESEKADLVSAGIQVGKTKVFLKRKAYETIERLRNLEMRNSAIAIQSIGRRYIVHRDFTESRRAAITVQCFVRCVVACRIVDERRRTHSATVIQAALRGRAAHKRYVGILYCCKFLQRIYRGKLGRELYRTLDRERKATVIQKTWKMCKVQSQFRQMRSATITVQCAVRCARARARLGVLRKLARDLSNTALERDQFQDENKQLGKALSAAMARIAEADAALVDNSMEKELRERETDVAELRRELERVRNSYDEEKVRAHEAEIALSDTMAHQEQLSNNELGLRSQITQLEELYALKGDETVQCRTDVDMLKEEVKFSMSRNADLVENEERISADLEALHKENGLLQQTLESTKKELYESNTEVSDLKQAVDSSTGELATAKAEHTQLSEKVEEQQQQLEAMFAIEFEKDQLFGEATQLRQVLDTVNGDLEGLREEHVSLEETIESTKKELDESKAEVSHLKQAIESSQQATDSSTIEFSAAETENKRLAEMVQQQQQQLQAVEGIEVEKERLSGEVVDLRQELDGIINGDLVSLREEKREVEQTLERTRKELDEAKAQVSHLNQSIESSQQATGSSTGELATANAENERLAENIRSQQQQIEGMEAIKVEKEQLTKEVARLRRDLDTVNGELASLREENLSLEETVESTKKDPDSSPVELAAFKAENERLAGKVDEQQQHIEAMEAIEAERVPRSDEVAKLRQELVVATAAKEQLDTVAESLNESADENRALSEQLDEQKVVNAKLQKEMQERVQTERSRMQELDSQASREMDAILQQGSSGLTERDTTDCLEAPMYSFGESEEEKEAHEDEIENLKDVISSLKDELKAVTAESRSSENLVSSEQDGGRIRRILIESKEASAEEILTLQDEVERLNHEISTMKMEGQTSTTSDQGPQIRRKDDQVNKLIDSIMAKDDEIRDLRREITILRDQLDATTTSIFSGSPSNRFIDDDDRSVVSKFFGMGQPPRAAAPAAAGDGKELNQLRSINETLRKELEAVKKERDGLERSIEDEREISLKELAAFGEALMGVNELRQAAEQMSREITRLKNQKDDALPEDPFGDVNDDAVQNFETGVAHFESAKRTIGTASLKSEQPGLWGKLRLNVRSLQETGDKKKDRVKSRTTRRVKENDGDDSSIFSSFF